MTFIDYILVRVNPLQPIKAGLNGALQRAWTTLFHTLLLHDEDITIKLHSDIFILLARHTTFECSLQSKPATETLANNLLHEFPPQLQAEAFPLKIAKSSRVLVITGFKCRPYSRPKT